MLYYSHWSINYYYQGPILWAGKASITGKVIKPSSPPWYIAPVLRSMCQSLLDLHVACTCIWLASVLLFALQICRQGNHWTQEHKHRYRNIQPPWCHRCVPAKSQPQGNCQQPPYAPCLTFFPITGNDNIRHQNKPSVWGMCSRTTSPISVC